MRRLAGVWWPALLLGLATIGAYGTVYYAIGVLIPTIAADSGWSAGALSGAFSLATLGQGAIALLSGRLLDSHGSRPVLLPSLAGGALLLLLASLAREQWQFVICWATGGAAVGGGLFYNVTMPVTARIYPERRATAFSVLTLLGALASPIFYPVAGRLSDAWGWRTALQALVALTVVCVAPAAIFVRSRPAHISAQRHAVREIKTALWEPVVYRALLVFGLAALANSALLLHQVSAMRAAGLSIGLASGFAGARGAFQIPGRLLLTPLTSRLGVRGTIGACYALAATAALALLIAVFGLDAKAMALYFSVVGGMSLGLLSPLNGLFQVEAFGEARLGTLTGVAVIVTSIAAALGAFLMGLALDLTGSYKAPLLAVMAVQGMAIAALVWQSAAVRHGSDRRRLREPLSDAAAGS
jgi:MFS family permease